MTILKRITMFIAPFMVLFLFSFKCSAEAVPTLSSGSFQLISGGAENAYTMGFTTQGIFPTDTSDPLSWIFNAVENYSPVFQFTSNDVTVSVIDPNSAEYTVLSDPNIRLTNSLGQTVSPDDVYSVQYDNGFFSGYGYCDIDGNFVDLNGTLAGTIKVGGSTFMEEHWNNFYQAVQAKVIQNNFVYPNEWVEEHVNFSDSSLYYHIGSVYSNNRGAKWQECYIYVPFIYDYPNVNAFPYTTSQPFSICINGNFYDYVRLNTWGDDITLPSNYIALNVSTNSYTDGKRFDYIVYPKVSSSDSNISISEFYNITPSYNGITLNYWIGDQVIPEWNEDAYRAATGEDSQYAMFKQIQFPEGTVVVLGDYYNITEIPEHLNDIEEVNPQPNPEFDPLDDIDEINYPYEYPVTPISPSTLPNPNPNSNPNPNPNPETDPYYQLDPEVSIPTTDNLFSNIPVFNNLQYRFPFSIPWDLSLAMQRLINPPTAPAWDFYWNITVANHTYSYHCVGDLSAFDDLARLLRSLLLLSAIVSLAVVSYKMFF